MENETNWASLLVSTSANRVSASAKVKKFAQKVSFFVVVCSELRQIWHTSDRKKGFPECKAKNDSCNNLYLSVKSCRPDECLLNFDSFRREYNMNSFSHFSHFIILRSLCLPATEWGFYFMCVRLQSCWQNKRKKKWKINKTKRKQQPKAYIFDVILLFVALLVLCNMYIPLSSI